MQTTKRLLSARVAISTLGIATVLSILAASPLIAATATIEQALRIVPVHENVDHDVPAAGEAVRCTIKAEKLGDNKSWVVRDPTGKTLRVFQDTNQDNVVDVWAYYRDGIEVYRDIDADFDGIAEQFRRLDAVPGTPAPVGPPQATSEERPPGSGEKYALLVGVKQYRKSELRSLRFSENDVADLAAVLRNTGYHEEHVILLSKAQADATEDFRFVPSSENIRHELGLILRLVRKGDTLIVAFSGHGVQFQGDPAAYFCPSDARLNDRQTLISLDDVFQDLADCPASTRLMIVDACRNDPFKGATSTDRGATIQLAPAGIRPRVSAGGLAALISCSASERSFENDQLAHGVFFHYVIEGLRGHADAAGTGEAPDGQITLAELEEYAVRNTQRFAVSKIGESQTPERRGQIQGSVVLTNISPNRTSMAEADAAE